MCIYIVCIECLKLGQFTKSETCTKWASVLLTSAFNSPAGLWKFGIADHLQGNYRGSM